MRGSHARGDWCESLRFFGGTARVHWHGTPTASDRAAVRELATMAMQYAERPEFRQFWFWAAVARALRGR